MNDAVVFYNHFGNGDIFESREFVKEYMEKIPAKDYYYAHGKPPRILADIPELQFTDVTEIMDGMNAITLVNGTIYINTWIGRDGRYVLPGIGCTVEKLYEMHNDILTALGIRRLEKEMFDYIPNIDYSYYNISYVQEFLDDHPKQKVLISNGNVYSNQAVNFDFTPAVDMLAKVMPEVTFILTQDADISRDNVIFTSDIIETDDGFDLNEISYLSIFCDTHVGRSSGPHVFAQVRENWLDSNKVSLSFTNMECASHFVWRLQTNMKKRWSGSTDVAGVYQAMFDAVRRI